MKLNINKKNISYIITWIIYYAWVIVFTTWWTSSPITDKLMGNDSRIILHSLNLISSAVFVCIIKKEWFKRGASIGGSLVLIFSILSMIKTTPLFHLISIILLSISLGMVNVSILVPLVYVMNKTEKLISIVGTNILISILILFQELNILTINNSLNFSFVMLFISIFPILFFKREDLNIENKQINLKLNKVMILSIILNCIYATLCKGIGKAFLIMAINNSIINLYPIYYLGAIVGCIIYFIIQKINKVDNYASWNIIFGLFAISMFIYSVSNIKELYYIFGFLMGIVSTMGMINMYYGLAVIGRKYWNHLYVKLSVLVIGILGGISGTIFGNIFSDINKLKISITLSVISTVVIILILVISPTLSKTYYKDEYDEKERNDYIINNNYKKFKLTTRERELCKILIEGYTLRQAAVMMNISYFTVNGYYKNIYKKMNVNNKLEFIDKIKGN